MTVIPYQPTQSLDRRVLGIVQDRPGETAAGAAHPSGRMSMRVGSIGRELPPSTARPPAICKSASRVSHAYIQAPSAAVPSPLSLPICTADDRLFSCLVLIGRFAKPGGVRMGWYFTAGGSKQASNLTSHLILIEQTCKQVAWKFLV